MKRILIASFLLTCLTLNAQNMENALTPRRQGLAVMAALEAKGDQAGLERAASEALDNGLTISEAKEALSQLYRFPAFAECAGDPSAGSGGTASGWYSG